MTNGEDIIAFGKAWLFIDRRLYFSILRTEWVWIWI